MVFVRVVHHVLAEGEIHFLESARQQSTHERAQKNAPNSNEIGEVARVQVQPIAEILGRVAAIDVERGHVD